ncbi:MAG: chemotaxis protein CheR [Moraxellaceae bacterium]|nr:MAG: chemotaxis protein CheR [Moraxellaceae bacterium]
MPKYQNDEDYDIHALLETIYLKWGYDFRGYSKASITRRIFFFLKEEKITRIPELQYQLVRDKALFYRFIRDVTVNVTEMFRDPEFYLSVKQNIIPQLKTYPHIKIWHAGCATGEEAYSLAILLDQSGILGRSTIYATDINRTVLDRAKKGIFSDSFLQQYEKNFNNSGLTGNLSDYFEKGYDHVIMDSRLRKNIVFTEHDLVIDHVFGEMQLIFCRNVLIYFTRELQNQVIDLFSESLDFGGYLCLGGKETLDFFSGKDKFITKDADNKIYQKTK